jgi:hypothetical protein
VALCIFEGLSLDGDGQKSLKISEALSSQLIPLFLIYLDKIDTQLQFFLFLCSGSRLDLVPGRQKLPTKKEKKCWVFFLEVCKFLLQLGSGKSVKVLQFDQKLEIF